MDTHTHIRCAGGLTIREIREISTLNGCCSAAFQPIGEIKGAPSPHRPPRHGGTTPVAIRALSQKQAKKVKKVEILESRFRTQRKH